MNCPHCHKRIIQVRRPPSVHYRKPGMPSGVFECGVWAQGREWLGTDVVCDVTCGRCRRYLRMDAQRNQPAREAVL